MRDSSRMRTKSLRIDSSVSCSTMCVPVAPPAKPVAITGWPSAFSVRAMLTPLPPAIVRCSTVRWRRPSRKFGTDSDLSIAALSVTVMIILALYPPSGDLTAAGAAARSKAAEWAEHRTRLAPRRPRAAPRPSACPSDVRPSDSVQAASRRRSASARAAAAGSPPARRWAFAMLREARDQAARPPGREGRREVLHAPPLGADARAAGRSRSPISSRARAQMAGLAWRRSPRPRRSGPPRRRRPRPAPSTIAATRSHSAPAALELEILDVRARPGLEVRTSTSTPAPASRAAAHERLDRVARPSAG